VGLFRTSRKHLEGQGVNGDDKEVNVFSSVCQLLRRRPGGGIGCSWGTRIVSWLCKFPRQHFPVFPHLHIDETIVWRTKMKLRKNELFLGVLLGAGLNLLNSLRERLPDNLYDVKTKVRDTYGTAANRISRASDALRGEEDSLILGHVGALLIGVGVGVGVGLLIAPAKGEETRADITEKVSEFGDKVRERTGKKPQNATGGHGEHEQAV
jgi:hypothetical protein